MKPLNHKVLLSLIGAAIGVYFVGMFLDLMNEDAAQYANISREMFERGSYLVVKHRLGHYLDKPPLLFWLSSFSLKLFGVSAFAYRIPSLLFSLLGLYSTYRLGSLLYTRQTGLVAATMLATCQATFLMNHDVRTDTMLAGAVIFSLWQLTQFSATGKWLNFVLGFIGVAMALLTKGPIGIMVPILALGTHFLYHRDWKNIFRWQWILGVAFVLVLLVPMMYGLYMHHVDYPNNPLYKNNPFYGLRFFFWVQSFGRITGESEWHNNQDPFFFVHTFVWSFWPWALMAYIGIATGIWAAFKKRNFNNPSFELISLAGVVLPFLAFSLSKYVLPHYIFVFFSLAAIVAANSFLQIVGNARMYKVFKVLQFIFIGAAFALASVICGVFFPTINPLIWLVVVLMLVLPIYFSFKKFDPEFRLLVPSAVSIILMNLVMNSYFYPNILKYQSDSAAAKVLAERHVPASQIATYCMGRQYFDFKTGAYSGVLHDSIDIASYVNTGNKWLFVDKIGYEKVKEAGLTPLETISFDEYHVTQLTLPFLLPQKRPSALKKTYLLRF